MVIDLIVPICCEITRKGPICQNVVDEPLFLCGYLQEMSEKVNEFIPITEISFSL